MSQSRLKKKYLRRAHHLLQRTGKTTPFHRKLQASVEPFICHHHDEQREHLKVASSPRLERSISVPESCTFSPPLVPTVEQRESRSAHTRDSHSDTDPLYCRRGLHSTPHRGSVPYSKRTDSHIEYTPPFQRTHLYAYSSTPIAHNGTQDFSSYQDTKQESELAVQLRVQKEVNRELKRLLVASVGSDLQHRLEQISEEKAQLSHNLDASLQQLMENSEEYDRVSIECDIWRSKFLASRVMVDELAGWKAELTLQFKDSQQALKCLLDERTELCKQLVSCNMELQKALHCLQLSSEDVSTHRLNQPKAQHHQNGKVALVSHTQCLSKNQPPNLRSHYQSSIHPGITVVDVSQANASLAKAFYHSVVGTRPKQGLLSHDLQNKENALEGITEPTSGEKMAKQILHVNQALGAHENRLPLPRVRLDEEELVRQRSLDRRSLSPLTHRLHCLTGTVEDPYKVPFHCKKCKGNLIIL